MSRIRFFDLANRSQGETEARCSRGWAITGNPNIRGGGQTSAAVSVAVAEQAFLQLGRMVLVEQANLPAWAGMIDPPWSAKAPVELTLYNVEYLLSLRKPDNPLDVTGSTATIASKIVELANAQEGLYLRMGKLDSDAPYLTTIDRTSCWDQLKKLVEGAGMEMTLRPDLQDGQLLIYVDIQKRAGNDIDFEYKDGEGANMMVTSAKISQPIINRVIGINDASSEESLMKTEAFLDSASIQLYRLRSDVVQFRNVTELSTLQSLARTNLNARSKPQLELTVKIKDKDKAFQSAALGNSALFHAASIYLPGGIHGWRGTARMMAMAYDEPSNTLGMTVIGAIT